MAISTLSPKHPVDASGEALLRAVSGLTLPEHVAAELKSYPESAGEILLEEAEALSRSGAWKEAFAVFDALVAHAPDIDDRQYAATSKAGDLLKAGDAQTRAEGERLVAELTAPSVLQEGPAGLLAELLEEHGDLEAALHCYNVASRQQLSSGVEGMSHIALSFAMALKGRTRVRGKLGHEPDEFDTAIAELPPPEEVLSHLVGAPGSPHHQPEYQPGRQILCARQDFGLACERGILTGESTEGGVDAYFRRAERVMREQPADRWSVVLLTVARIEEYARKRGGDPTDGNLRLELGDSLPVDDPQAVDWPPARNEACWCSSGRKYKKCCGSAANR